MMIVEAPNEVGREHSFRHINIFLGGSIEMGKAEDWQSAFPKKFEHKEHVCFFNPRRRDWDSSWIQDPTPGTKFHEQVSWELDKLAKSDIIVFHFESGTQSPITLMELGYAAALREQAKVYVSCNDGFWRYGNVKVFSDRNGFQVFDNLESLQDAVLEFVNYKY
jgi:hypothetical protein